VVHPTCDELERGEPVSSGSFWFIPLVLLLFAKKKGHG
jgi:hypothetical protein